jgi:hypothetical protein
MHLSVCSFPFFGIQLTSTIDVASFMWLAAGAYAEHNVETAPYFPYLDGAPNNLWGISKL